MYKTGQHHNHIWSYRVYIIFSFLQVFSLISPLLMVLNDGNTACTPLKLYLVSQLSSYPHSQLHGLWTLRSMSPNQSPELRNFKYGESRMDGSYESCCSEGSIIYEPHPHWTSWPGMGHTEICPTHWHPSNRKKCIYNVSLPRIEKFKKFLPQLRLS